MSGSRNRKSYTPTYRREAAHLVMDTGRPIVEVAQKIALERAELARLRTENGGAADGPGVLGLPCRPDEVYGSPRILADLGEAREQHIVADRRRLLRHARAALHGTHQGLLRRRRHSSTGMLSPGVVSVAVERRRGQGRGWCQILLTVASRRRG